MTPPKASDAAIEREIAFLAAKGFNMWFACDYGKYEDFTAHCDERQTLSDALRTVHGDNVPASLAGFVLPVVVDPIVEAARRICAACAPSITDYYLAGKYDDETQMVLAIAELRAIAARGGEK